MSRYLLRHLSRICCLLFAVLACYVPVSSPAAASKPAPYPIVYSARYYKPGKDASLYHLWRINPDGSGRMQVTSSKFNDHSPMWLADGHTLLFLREENGANRFYSVTEGGGRVTPISTASWPQVYVCGFSPDRRWLVFQVNDGNPRLFLLDIPAKTHRLIGSGYGTVASPDSRQLFYRELSSTKPAVILDIVSGKHSPLTPDLDAAAWLSDDLLVAAIVAPEPAPPRLCLLRSDGARERELSVPFNWNEDLPPFPDDLFSIPGDTNSVIYGRHAGNSTQGSAHRFYRIDLKTGKPTLLAEGRDLAWSTDKLSFCTGGPRDLATLDKQREVWVSPLHVVSLKTGARRTIVQGMVSVGGFDWRPAPISKTPARK